MRDVMGARDQSEISIREAKEADLVFVCELLNAEIATSPYVYAESPVSVDERRDWLATHVAAGLPVFVAVESGVDASVIGWAALSAYRAARGYRFTSEASVYVSRRAQRRGIGGSLLSKLCDEARRLGHHRIAASIDAENSASIALFEKHGFREVARLDDVGYKFGAWRTQLLLLRAV